MNCIVGIIKRDSKTGRSDLKYQGPSYDAWTWTLDSYELVKSPEQTNWVGPVPKPVDKIEFETWSRSPCVEMWRQEIEETLQEIKEVKKKFPSRAVRNLMTSFTNLEELCKLAGEYDDQKDDQAWENRKSAWEQPPWAQGPSSTHPAVQAYWAEPWLDPNMMGPRIDPVSDDYGYRGRARDWWDKPEEKGCTRRW